MPRKIHPVRAFAIVAITACSSIAYAYILPADAILSSVSKRRSKIALKSLVVEGTLEVGTDAPHPVWEVLVPGKAHRIEHKLQDKTIVQTTVGARRWTQTLGQAAERAKIVTDDPFMTFLGAASSDPGGKRGLAFCDRLKIDTSVVSLSRLDKRVAFVIGAKPWETNKPQLWIDKILRVPVRLVTVDGSGNVVDQQLHGFGSAVTGEWYPRTYERYDNGTLTQRVVYDQVQVNVPVEPQLLEPPTS
ncbi:MAG: hypothetical protein RMA76_28495 [Deltaproteobacteria bacterium]|jgi:hypothetical protein